MSLKPIVMDLEMSGLNMTKCGIWQIGAIDLNTMEEFLEEGRIDEEDIVEKEALVVIGKTEEELRDKNKRSQKELLEKFFDWINERQTRTFLCQNPQFDVAWLGIRTQKYGLKKPYNYRTFDLHTIAQIAHLNIFGNFLFESRGSKMSLGKIIDISGMKDERIQVISGEVEKEGKPHNALSDCKLTAECFSRIVYGKNLFDEFAEFDIPKYLLKEENKNGS
jgi:DNA polymerase III epsilon subunit-like protein